MKIFTFADKIWSYLHMSSLVNTACKPKRRVLYTNVKMLHIETQNRLCWQKNSTLTRRKLGTHHYSNWFITLNQSSWWTWKWSTVENPLNLRSWRAVGATVNCCCAAFCDVLTSRRRCDDRRLCVTDHHQQSFQSATYLLTYLLVTSGFTAVAEYRARCILHVQTELENPSVDVAPNTFATFSSRDLELWPMTLTNNLWDHRAKCLVQKSFCSKVIIRAHRDTHTTDQLLYTATKLVDNNFDNVVQRCPSDSSDFKWRLGLVVLW